MVKQTQELLVPIGKVRHPDPVAPLERLVNETLTVGDIVSSPLWFISGSMPVKDAIAAMELHEFDIGGVGPEPLAFFVELEDLKKAGSSADNYSVDGFAKPIPASLCIERSLPISQLFPLLRDQPRLFVLNGDQVRWLVTRADLAAPAVGATMLGFFTVFEAGLKELSRDISDERLKEILRGKDPLVPDEQVSANSRLGKALRIYRQLHEKNLHTEFRDCLSLPDWLTVLRKEPALRQLLGFRSASALKDQWGSFPDMRNDVAHVRSLLHTSSIEDAIAKIESVRDAGRHVWTVVRHQAAIWERYLTSIVTMGGTSPETLTGADAVEVFPFPDPVHVLSAWNPGSVWRSDSVNRQANVRLADAVGRQGKPLHSASAQSPDGVWSEECFVVEHMTDRAAAELAATFGQMSVFKITNEEFLVMDARSAKVVKTSARRHQPPNPD